MDWQLIGKWTQQVLGIALTGLILADVFLTVLYARLGTGILSPRLARWIWRVFRHLGGRGTQRPAFLAMCGPCIVVTVIAFWVWMLVLGLALIIHPALGSGVAATGGSITPTDFITAMYVAGDSMTTVGTSDLAPRTTFYRLLYLFASFIGISTITMTITYLLEVYNSLQSRNTFALKLHMASSMTGDAAELLARIGAGGKPEIGYALLAESAAEMVHFKETHHFYPVIFYFRFQGDHYAFPRLMLLVLDTVTLTRTALDGEEYRWLQESVAVTQLWHSTRVCIDRLDETFLPRETAPPREPDSEQWRKHYAAALQRLRTAGLQVVRDQETGFARYVALRRQWDHSIQRFEGYLGYSHLEIDRSTFEGTVVSTDQRR